MKSIDCIYDGAVAILPTDIMSAACSKEKNDMKFYK